MTQSQISVARVLELDVPLSWQECVAIAGEVTGLRAVAASLGQRPLLIDAESCFLGREGEVLLPVTAAADLPGADLQLLRALLAGRDIPVELEQLAYGPTPEHLGDALAMFSRPDRRADIAAVAERALVADVQLRTSSPKAAPSDPVAAPVVPDAAAVGDDIAALRAHVGQRPAAPRAPVPQPPPRRPQRFGSAAAVVAASAVVVIAGGYWVTHRSPSAPAPAPSVPDDLLAEQLDVPTEVDKWWDVSGRRTEDVDLGRTPPRRATRSSAPSQGRASVGDGEKSSGAPATIVPPGEPSTAALSTDGSASTTATPSAEAPVYSWRSPDIDPPVMVFPRMPKAAFPPSEVAVQGQYIEVLVGQSGTVEAVRLRGTPPAGTSAYHYAMILAAAKAWQFTPARRNGEAVRYVARVVLER